MKACKPEALRLKQEWEALNSKPKVQREPRQDQNLDKMTLEPEPGQDKDKPRFLSMVKEEDLELEKQAKKPSKRKRE